MARNVHLLLFLWLTAWVSLGAQNGHLKKANQLFKDQQYAEAAKEYEKHLAIRPDFHGYVNWAYCCRKLNDWKTAEILYTRILQEKKAKPKMKYYLGEAKLYKGEYVEAKQLFLEYHALVPEDTLAAFMAQQCDLVRDIGNYFHQSDSSVPIVVAYPYNSDADENTPWVWQNQLIFTSDRERKGGGFLKEKSGWTGRDYLRLYASQMDSTFISSPKPWEEKFHVTNFHTSGFSTIKRGDYAVFGRNALEPGRDEAYHLQLYEAVLRKGKWEDVQILSFCQPGVNYMHPALTPSGDTLFFASDRGGKRGLDIWYVTRTKKGWSQPINVGPQINTPNHDAFPFIHPDGRLFYASKGKGGFGGFDIFVSERNRFLEWDLPVNLGLPVNSPADDISFWMRSDSTLAIFASGRAKGNDDLYLMYLPKKIETQLEAVISIPGGELLDSAGSEDTSFVSTMDSVSNLTLINMDSVPKNLDSIQITYNMTPKDSTDGIPLKDSTLVADITMQSNTTIVEKKEIISDSSTVNNQICSYHFIVAFDTTAQSTMQNVIHQIQPYWRDRCEITYYPLEQNISPEEIQFIETTFQSLYGIHIKNGQVLSKESITKLSCTEKLPDWHPEKNKCWLGIMVVWD